MFCAGFFRLQLSKSHLAVQIWCGKRDKHFSSHSWKGGEIMKPSDSQKTIQCQFECKLKKVTKGIVRNYQKELKRRKNKEIPFCELPELVIEKLSVLDDYDSDYTLFNVCGNDISILDDELAEALIKKYNKYHTDKLPNITLHSFRHTYCTNMANRGMNPNTLQYLMGHANITMTRGYYAHGTFQSAKAELERLAC